MATWNFSEVRPGDKTREPIQGEFFTNDSIGRSGEALVREGIQNALDAGLPSQTVHIRIFVSGPNAGVPANKHSNYFDDVAWEHLCADGNGLTNPPNPRDDCPFIVFEDFGTIGLQGDVEQYHPVSGQRNPFYHFVRAEGRSDKGENERGRWGVGKFVFPRSSRINSNLCASIRADDARKVIIGQTVLKTHSIQDKVYTPDGFFGDLAENGLTLPIENAEAFDDICRTFSLERGDRSGLSLVIPWHDPDINAETLLEATAIGYFYPILAGRLTVSIETPESKIELDSSSILSVAESVTTCDSIDLAAFCRLASFACRSDERIETRSPDQNNSVKWCDDMLTEENKKQITGELDDGEIVGVRIPLVVHTKGGQSSDSHFDVFLVRDAGHHSGRPVFVREGIIISDVQARRNRGIRSLIVIEDGALATLLGDAENPSHTRWENGSNFKDKYRYGKSYINFVTNATSDLIASLADAEQEVDQTLLSDFFFLPDDDTQNHDSKGGRRKRGKARVKPKPPTIPRTPPRYNITKQDGGFQIVGKEATVPPDLIEVKVAYDVRRGSALKKYDPADFLFGKHGVGVTDQRGVTVLSEAENRLLIQIDETNFRCVVAGFDTERDLYIDARAKEAANDN